MTYTIIDRGKTIKCKICGWASFNMNDVESLYCGHCHIFHENLEKRVLAFLQVAMRSNRQVWIDDANVILQGLEGHPGRAHISIRLGFLHSLVLEVAKKG